MHSLLLLYSRGVYFTEYTDRTPPTRALRRPLYVISSLAPALLINSNTQAHQATRLPGCQLLRPVKKRKKINCTYTLMVVCFFVSFVFFLSFSFLTIQFYAHWLRLARFSLLTPGRLVQVSSILYYTFFCAYRSCSSPISPKKKGCSLPGSLVISCYMRQPHCISSGHVTNSPEKSSPSSSIPRPKRSLE